MRDGWYIQTKNDDNSFEVCKEDKKTSKKYCLRPSSPGFEKASKNGLAPKTRKSIGLFIIHDNDKKFKEINSDLSSYSQFLPIVLKEISRLHKLGLVYNGKIYLDKTSKRVHFVKFREREKMSPLEWIFEMIKDYETLIVLHRTEYSMNPNMKKFVSKIDKTIKSIAKVL
jgi:hypothetical protein